MFHAEKQSVSSSETKCFSVWNGLFQALKQFLKLIATGEEMVKLLHFTRKLLIHRRDREKVKEEMKRWITMSDDTSNLWQEKKVRSQSDEIQGIEK